MKVINLVFFCFLFYFICNFNSYFIVNGILSLFEKVVPFASHIVFPAPASRTILAIFGVRSLDCCDFVFLFLFSIWQECSIFFSFCFLPLLSLFKNSSKKF